MLTIGMKTNLAWEMVEGPEDPENLSTNKETWKSIEDVSFLLDSP